MYWSVSNSHLGDKQENPEDRQTERSCRAEKNKKKSKYKCDSNSLARRFVQPSERSEKKDS